LLAAIVLLSLAGAQTAVMLEGIARFGLERTAIGPMGGRALASVHIWRKGARTVDQ